MVQIAIRVRSVGLSKNKQKKVNTFRQCIFHLYGVKTPTEPIVTIFGTSRELTDVINCAKFRIDRSRGYDRPEVQKSLVLIGKKSRP
jgi:hypothetical protein